MALLNPIPITCRALIISCLMLVGVVPVAHAQYQFIVPVHMSNIPETASTIRVGCIAGEDITDETQISAYYSGAHLLVYGTESVEIPENRAIDQEVTVTANYIGGSIDEGYALTQYKCALQVRPAANDWCIPRVDHPRSACRLDPEEEAIVQVMGEMPVALPGY